MKKVNRSDYLMDDYPIILLPKAARLLGDRHAYVLQKIHWWTQNFKAIEELLPPEQRMHFYQGRWWVYNTMDQWHQNNFDWLSKRTLETIFADLEQRKLLLVRKPEAANWDHTKWYTVDQGELDQQILIYENPNIDPAEIAESNPQNLRDQNRNNSGIYIDIINNHNKPTYPVGLGAERPEPKAPAPPEKRRLYEGVQFEYQPPWEIGEIDETPQNGDNSFTSTIGYPKPSHRSKKSERLAAQPMSLFERAVLQAHRMERFLNDKQRKTIMDLESAMTTVEMIAKRTGEPAVYPSMEFINSTLLWSWKNKKALNQFIAAVENENNWFQFQSFKQSKEGKGNANNEPDYESSTQFTNLG